MQTLECHMIRATADVALPPIGPELVHCLDRVTDDLITH